MINSWVMHRCPVCAYASEHTSGGGACGATPPGPSRRGPLVQDGLGHPRTLLTQLGQKILGGHKEHYCLDIPVLMVYKEDKLFGMLIIGVAKLLSQKLKE